MSSPIPAPIRRPGTVAALAIAALLAACTDSTGPADQPSGASADQVVADPGGPAQHMMMGFRLTTSLKPPALNPRYPAARGDAGWDRDWSHRDLHITARYLPPGLRVDFYVGGRKIGTTHTVNSYGRVTLDADTRYGYYVPWDCHGQAVVVKTTSGVVAVRGTFPY